MSEMKPVPAAKAPDYESNPHYNRYQLAEYLSTRPEEKARFEQWLTARTATARAERIAARK